MATEAFEALWMHLRGPYHSIAVEELNDQMDSLAGTVMFRLRTIHLTNSDCPIKPTLPHRHPYDPAGNMLTRIEP